MPCLDSFLEVLSSDESANESTRKGVTSAISVDDLVVRKGMHREDLRAVGLFSRNQHSRLRALGKDNDTGTGRILFGKECNGPGDSWEVFDVRIAIGRCP